MFCNCIFEKKIRHIFKYHLWLQVKNKKSLTDLRDRFYNPQPQELQDSTLHNLKLVLETDNCGRLWNFFQTKATKPVRIQILQLHQSTHMQRMRHLNKLGLIRTQHVAQKSYILPRKQVWVKIGVILSKNAWLLTWKVARAAWKYYNRKTMFFFHTRVAIHSQSIKQVTYWRLRTMECEMGLLVTNTCYHPDKTEH